MITILTIIFSSIFTSLLGYWVHRLFHSSISGIFYQAHMNHHLVQYPPEDFVSDVYRTAGKDNSLWYFTIAFSPLMIMIVLSHFILGISLWTCACILVSMIITGLAHDYIHDGFHLNKSIWQYIPNFQRLQELHKIHHIDMSKNFGIFSFVFDKLFKTYQDK